MTVEEEVNKLKTRIKVIERDLESMLVVRPMSLPRFKVGDYAVYCGEDYVEYVKIDCIHMAKDGTHHYDKYEDSERLRLPEEWELIYFR